MGTFSGLMAGSSALGLLVHEGTDKPLMVWRIQNDAGEGMHRGSVTPLRLTRAGSMPTDAARNLYKFILSGDTFQQGDKKAARRKAQDHVYNAIHPNPALDFPDDWAQFPKEEQEQYRFGFPTKDAALMWVGSYMPALSREGFKLVRVPASRVFLSKSGTQLVYLPWSKESK
jgi:hypothetical protein